MSASMIPHLHLWSGVTFLQYRRAGNCRNSSYVCCAKLDCIRRKYNVSDILQVLNSVHAFESPSTFASLDLRRTKTHRRIILLYLIMTLRSVSFATSNLLLVVNQIGIASPDLGEEQGGYYDKG